MIESVRRFFNRIDSGFFAPANPGALGAARLVFFTVVMLQSLHPMFHLWTRLYPEFWSPIWFLKLIGARPPSMNLVRDLEWVWLILLTSSAVGLFTGPSVVAAAVLMSYLVGIKSSAGYLNRIDNTVALSMWIFAFSNCGDAWSLDRWLRKWVRTRTVIFESSGAYGWPIRAIWIVWCLPFFLAGISKLRYSGLAWIYDEVTRQELLHTTYLFAEYTSGSIRQGLGTAAAQWPRACMLLSFGGLLLELSTPLVLFGRWFRVLLVPSAAMMQLGIYFLMGINFSHFLPVYLMFIPWNDGLLKARDFLRRKDFKKGRRLPAILTIALVGLGMSGVAFRIYLSWPPSTSCNCRPGTLRWPLDGLSGRDWIINGQVDTSEAGSTILEDEEGRRGDRAQTSPGHHGLDIDIATFAAMGHGVDIHAVAAGRVMTIHDGEKDDNVLMGESCEGLQPYGNYLTIRDPEGREFLYAHLKIHSLAVQAGQAISQGQKLAQVGSSGCSAQPHLHLEMKNCRGEIMPSLKSGLFASPPMIHPKLNLLALTIAPRPFQRLSEIISSTQMMNTTSSNTELGIAFATAGGEDGDQIEIKTTSPKGREKAHYKWQVESVNPAHRYWNWATTLGPQKGPWSIEIYFAGTQVSKTQVEVY